MTKTTKTAAAVKPAMKIAEWLHSGPRGARGCPKTALVEAAGKVKKNASDKAAREIVGPAVLKRYESAMKKLAA